MDVENGIIFERDDMSKKYARKSSAKKTAYTIVINHVLKPGRSSDTSALAKLCLTTREVTCTSTSSQAYKPCKGLVLVRLKFSRACVGACIHDVQRM